MIDARWRRRYKEVVLSNVALVDLPTGKVSERFVTKLRDEFKGVRDRKWNSERVIVFLSCVLRKEPGRQKYSEIRKLIGDRLDMWDAGEHAILVRNAVERGKVNTISRRRNTEEQVARKYNAMVLAGKVRSAVRQATQRGGAGSWILLTLM